jgi:hypothetical protein
MRTPSGELPRVLTEPAARQLGLTRSAVRNGIARRGWRPLARGVVLTAPDEPTRADWALVGLAAAGPRSALSGWDALRLLGPGVAPARPPTDDVLLLTRRGRNRRIGSVRVRVTQRPFCGSVHVGARPDAATRSSDVSGARCRRYRAVPALARFGPGDGCRCCPARVVQRRGTDGPAGSVPAQQQRTVATGAGGTRRRRAFRCRGGGDRLPAPRRRASVRAERADHGRRPAGLRSPTCCGGSYAPSWRSTAASSTSARPTGKRRCAGTTVSCGRRPGVDRRGGIVAARSSS